MDCVWVTTVGSALVLAGCGGAGGDGDAESSDTDSAPSGSQTASPTGSGTTGSGSASMSGSGSAGSAEGSGEETGSSGDPSETGSGPTTWQECADDAQANVDCDAGGAELHWVAFSPEGGCLASNGGGQELAQFLFRLDEVVDGEPQIRGLRIAVATANATDERIEFTVEPPVPYASLELSNAWQGFAKPMTLAGGLTFVDATGTDAELEFDSIPAFTDLGELATLRGTFSIAGASLTVLDDAGDLVGVDSPEFVLRGCFDLPADAHPLELDE